MCVDTYHRKWFIRQQSIPHSHWTQGPRNDILSYQNWNFTWIWISANEIIKQATDVCMNIIEISMKSDLTNSNASYVCIGSRVNMVKLICIEHIYHCFLMEHHIVIMFKRLHSWNLKIIKWYSSQGYVLFHCKNIKRQHYVAAEDLWWTVENNIKLYNTPWHLTSKYHFCSTHLCSNARAVHVRLTVSSV